MVFDKDFEESFHLECMRLSEKKRKLDKEEICKLTVKDFFERGLGVYDKCDNGIEIPMRNLLRYFDDSLTKDIVYCSDFQLFSLSKNNGWFRVKCLYTDDPFVIMCKEEGCFNVRGNAKLSDVLDKIYKIAYKKNVDFLETCEYIINNKDYPADVESLGLQEFIIRNAEKYDIDFCYAGSGVEIINIGEKWIWN